MTSTVTCFLNKLESKYGDQQMGTKGAYVFVQWQTSLEENAHGHTKQFEVHFQQGFEVFLHVIPQRPIMKSAIEYAGF